MKNMRTAWSCCCRVIELGRAYRAKCTVVVLICAVCLVVNSGATIACGYDDGTVLTALNNIWNAQRSEILSARIEYRVARRGPAADKPITVADFRALLGDAEISSPNGVDRLVRKLDPHATPESPVSVAQELTVKGNWQRVSSPADGDERTEVRTDLADIRIRGGGSTQIDVYAPGDCPVSMTSLGGLRMIPDTVEPDESVKVSEIENDWIAIESPHGNLRIVTDLNSGFVHEYSKGTETGSMSLTLQYGPTQYANGIVFPECRVDGVFKDGVLSLFTITLITKAQCNIHIANEAFDVAGRVGSKIIDYRDGRRSYNMVVLDRCTTSVLASLDQGGPNDILQISRATEDDSPRVSSNRWRAQQVAIATTVVLLMAATVCVMWRRHRLRP